MGISNLMTKTTQEDQRVIEKHQHQVGNCASKDYVTSLISATEKGSVTEVMELLRHDCDVNMVPLSETKQYGDGALHVASSKGNVDVVQLLLQHDADVNVTSFGGRTPLMKACLHGNLDVARELVFKGAEVNQKDYQGMTAFLYSCMKGHEGVAKFLLDNNADINIRNWKGETGLVLAVKEDHYDVIKLLLSQTCDVNIVTRPKLQGTSDLPPGSTALHFASRDGHVRMARDLIKFGAKINSQNCLRLTPLHYSCSDGHLEVVKVLLENNCKVNIRNSRGESALYEAVIGKYPRIVELLLKHQADPDIATGSGDRPLLRAVSMNSVELVKLLILANCDVTCCEHLLEQTQDKKQVRLVRFNKQSMKILKMLLFAGVGIQILLRIVNEKYSHTSQITNNHIESGPHPIEQQLTCLWNDCFTLKQLCRKGIRKAIGLDIQKKVDLMNLPIAMKKYVLLEEVN